MDGKEYENKIVTMDDKTISMNIFIPKDKHEVKITGIRNQLKTFIRAYPKTPLLLYVIQAQTKCIIYM